MQHFYLQPIKPNANLFFVMCFISCIGVAQASPEDSFRRILLQQVTEEITDPSLLRDIVEIRFNREFNHWIEAQAQKEKPFQSKVEKNLDRTQEGLNYFGRPSTYAGIGTKTSIGFNNNINENFGYRFDISGKNTSNYTQRFGTNSYQVNESNLSLGAYLDWFPFAGNFKFSIGINLNKIKTSASLNENTIAQVNRKNVATSSESLDITYEFPKLSPFLGFGYQTRNVGDYGWSSFVDIGLMFGKFNADARTNLVGQNSVNLNDINYEINTVRGKLFRGNYIPTAVIGLKYSY